MRIVIAIVGALLILGALAGIKWCQFDTLADTGKQAEKMGPPPEAVGVATAAERSWENTINAVGSVAPSRGVTVSNEVAGTVTEIRFQSGTMVREGQVLVTLDAGVEKGELRSVQAAVELARINATRARELARSGAIARAEVDTAEAELKSQTARAASLRESIQRKVIRAPFAGRLGIRQVNLGQYLAPGTPITSLETGDTLFVDFTLPQQRLPDVVIGMPVRVRVEGLADGKHDGFVAAVDPAIEPTTRAVRVRATVPDPDRALRAGMFVDVEVMLPRRDRVVSVPATAIVHASYGDSVFVVEDKKPDDPGMRKTPDGKPVKVARQQFVRTGPRQGDFVGVVAGLKAGQLVVSAGAFKLRNGAPIYVTDAPVPEPSLHPKLENR